jgi:hypothetical protein
MGWRSLRNVKCLDVTPGLPTGVVSKDSRFYSSAARTRDAEALTKEQAFVGRSSVTRHCSINLETAGFVIGQRVWVIAITGVNPNA